MVYRRQKGPQAMGQGKTTPPSYHSQQLSVAVDLFLHADGLEGDVQLGGDVRDDRQAQIGLDILDHIHDRKIGAGYEYGIRTTGFLHRLLGRPVYVADRGDARFRESGAQAYHRSSVKAPLL